MRLGRQARDGMNEETGFKRNEQWWFILVAMRDH